MHLISIVAWEIYKSVAVTECSLCNIPEAIGLNLAEEELYYRGHIQCTFHIEQPHYVKTQTCVNVSINDSMQNLKS